MTAQIDDKLFRCWFTGMSIGATRLAVRRAFGDSLTFEQIRRRFADFAEGWAG